MKRILDYTRHINRTQVNDSIIGEKVTIIDGSHLDSDNYKNGTVTRIASDTMVEVSVSGEKRWFHFTQVLR
jgi:hypothetical protein